MFFSSLPFKAACTTGSTTTRAKRWSPKNLVSTAAARTERCVVTCKSALSYTTFTRHRPVAFSSRGRTHAAPNCIVVSDEGRRLLQLFLSFFLSRPLLRSMAAHKTINRLHHKGHPTKFQRIFRSFLFKKKTFLLASAAIQGLGRWTNSSFTLCTCRRNCFRVVGLRRDYRPVTGFLTVPRHCSSFYPCRSCRKENDLDSRVATLYLFVSDVNAATASPNASRLLRKDPTGQVAAWKVREDLRKRLVKHLAKSSTDKQGMLRLVVAYSTKFTESLRYLLCQVAWRKGRCMPKVRPWWLLRLANIVSASRGSRRALNRDAPSPYWKDASPAFEISPAAQLTTIAVNNEISHLLFLTRRQTIGTAHPTAKVFHPFFDGILDI